MLKIIALGAVGYFAYKYFARQGARPGDLRLAGGPLSSKAVLQHTPDAPPLP